LLGTLPAAILFVNGSFVNDILIENNTF
jgi:hypothetical protein